MVSSPMYERLKVFMAAARSNRDLDAWDSDHQQTIKGLEEAVERLKQYRDSQGFEGKAAEAMNAWVDRAVQRINAHADTYRSGHNTYQAGRLAMASALHEANLLSPTLLDSATEAIPRRWRFSSGQALYDRRRLRGRGRSTGQRPARGSGDAHPRASELLDGGSEQQHARDSKSRRHSEAGN